MYLDRMKQLRTFVSTLAPRKLKMMAWINIDKLPSGTCPSNKVMATNGCGTTACIAGWTAVRFNLLTKQEWRWEEELAQEKAAAFLGLSDTEQQVLFLLQWPAYLNPFGEKLDWSVYAESGSNTGPMRRFDAKLTGAQRKRAILKVLDWIIDYGFTWVPEEDRSTRFEKFTQLNPF